MSEYVQLLVNAATNAAVYSLIAFSLVLVYRGSGVINFGVGYMAVFAGIFFANSGSGGWTALLFALLLGALLGVVAYLGAVWVGERFGAPHAALAMATLGFGLVLEYFAGVFWSKEGFTGPTLWAGSNSVAGVTISHQRMLTVLLAVVCFLVILVLLEKTMVGWALEAVAFRRDTAAAYGVNTGLAMLAVWALAGLVAALGGSLLASFSAVSAPVSLPLAVMGFAAAVVGGLGSVGGAVVGAVVVSVAETLFIHYVSTAYSGAFAFLLLFVVLAVRPQGIVGVRRQLSRT
jgi:branched-chain amino acid transport system permease protein